jgi:predicted hydrocarbon binding protein
MSDRPRDTDLVRMPAITLRAMRDVLRRQKGAMEGAQLLRDIGLASGEAFYTLLRESLASDDGTPRDPESFMPVEFWSRLSGLFSDLGWGRLEHEQLAEGVFALTALDWVEADDAANGGASCHFTAGLLADILHRLAGEDLAVLEVEHAAVGNGACRFIVGSPETLEAVFLHIREGTGYAEAIRAVNVAS